MENIVQIHEKLLNRTLKVNDVSKKLTLDKILKFDLGY
jgi:hypothetical protein